VATECQAVQQVCGTAEGQAFRRAALSCLIALLACLLVLPVARAEDGLRIGASSWLADTPTRLASQMDLFNRGSMAAGGAGIEVVPYGSGRDALAALMRHEVDFAVCAATPLAEQLVWQTADAGLRQDAPVAIASILLSSGTHPIIANRHTQIASVRDLAGRRLGLPLGTSAHMAWTQLAEFAGLDSDAVELVDLPLDQQAEALASNRVDAIATWEPWASVAVTRLGEAALRLDTRHVYTVDWMLVARRDWAASHPDAVDRVLRTYVEAIRMLVEDPSLASHLVHPAGEVSSPVIDPTSILRLRLSWSTLVAIHSAIEWQLEREGRPAWEGPDPHEFIDPRHLLRIDPDAVYLPTYLTSPRSSQAANP